MLWVLQIVTGTVFVVAGSAKLLGTPRMVAEFNAIGFGELFRDLAGIFEVSGGIGLLIPGLAPYAAILLGAIMVGALSIHVFLLGNVPYPAIALLAVNGIIVWGRLGKKAPLPEIGQLEP
jgi:putative oxidoreductase